MSTRILVSLLTASCTLAATAPAHAQGRAFGLKGGVTLASADIEDIEGTFDADNRTGWGIGAFLTLGGGRISVQPELNFVENGFETSTPFGDADVQLRYFVPTVLLRLGLPLVLVRPGVFGGVGIGVEAGCEINGVPCEDTPYSLETEATDPTAFFGADVDVTIGPGASLRADVRYGIGFSDIHKASDVWTEIKNRAWAVSAGVAFRL